MEHHETSIFYGPVNALLERFGMHAPDHIIMALFVLVLSTVLFGLATRNLSKLTDPPRDPPPQDS